MTLRAAVELHSSGARPKWHGLQNTEPNSRTDENNKKNICFVTRPLLYPLRIRGIYNHLLLTIAFYNLKVNIFLCWTVNLKEEPIAKV
jgi:hypothetical protein